MITVNETKNRCNGITTVKEIYDSYLAVETECRKINEKICDKERAIRRFEKQIKNLEHKRYSFNWVDYLAKPLAQALLPYLDCDRYEIYGPFGLRAYIGISFYKPNAIDKKDSYYLSLTCHHEFNDDSTYKGEYCSASTKSVHLKYDTYKRTAEYPQGSIGWLNGFNVVEEPLPDTLEELAKFIKNSKENDNGK